MSRPAFTPLGTEPRWKTVYEQLQKAGNGKVLSYDRLGKLLDLNPVRDRAKIAQAVYRAERELLEKDQRALECVSGTGYRVVFASEQLRLAKGQQKKARKALVAGHALVVNVDRGALDNEQAAKFDAAAYVLSRQVELARSTSKQQSRIERALASASGRKKLESGGMLRELDEAV